MSSLITFCYVLSSIMVLLITPACVTAFTRYTGTRQFSYGITILSISILFYQVPVSDQFRHGDGSLVLLRHFLIDRTKRKLVTRVQVIIALRFLWLYNLWELQIHVSNSYLMLQCVTRFCGSLTGSYTHFDRKAVPSEF